MIGVVFVTNYCPRKCPYCICGCDGTRRNFLDIDRIKKFLGRADIEYSYITGGEPAFHMDVTSIIEAASNLTKRVAVFTSLPIVFTPVDKVNVSYRVSMSDHLLSTDQDHKDKIILFRNLLSKSKIHISGWDQSIKSIIGVSAVKVPLVESFGTYMDKWDPIVRSLNSDGTEHIWSNFKAHRYEAR